MRRWATTHEMADEMRNGSSPISMSRDGVDDASLVCSVDSTRWPVSAASMAIVAVSRSRISPTSTMSGSERRMERSADANVSPAFGLTCTWLMPARRYSTGSSTVITFFDASLIWLSVAYSVVDLPEPVGPVTRIVPYGRSITDVKRSSEWGRKPRSVRPSSAVDLSSTRMTTFSP